jgi:hypothetical protein
MALTRGGLERGFDSRLDKGPRSGWIRRLCRGSKMALLSLGVVVLLPQCHLVLDDVDPSRSRSDASGGTAGVPAQTGGDSTGTGGSAPSSTCSRDGAYRCDESSLQICEAGSYKPIAACGSPEQCDGGRGVCLDCAPGSMRCVGWRAETCVNSDTKQGWQLQEDCKTAELCDVATRGCLACAKEAASCSGSLLYVCADDQLDWNVTDCKEARLCNARAKECLPCTPGEYQCNGKSLQRCDDARNWASLDECVTNELCQATLTARAADPSGFDGTCVPPGCPLGVFRCSPTDGAQIEGCPGSQLDWEPILGQHCATAALCNATTGRCDPGCVPGSYRCLSDRLEVCNSEGTGYDLEKTCSNAAYCSATKRDCVPCVLGEYQCSGSLLQKCNANQTWATQATCVSDALCLAGLSSGTTCKLPVCGAGEFRCNNGKELQICAENRNGWETRTNCVTAALCDPVNGRCNPPECAVGESRCFQNAYQACDATTRKWGPAQKCTSAELCTSAGTDHCIDGCPTPNLQCNGAELQRCNLVPNPETGNNEAKWNETVAVCATAALCSEATGGCIAPTCKIDDHICAENVLRSCNAARTGYVDTLTCDPDQICDPVGKQCDTCLASSFSCDGALLRECSANGQTWAKTTDCTAASLCYATGAAGRCYLCVPNEVACVGTTGVHTCSATGSAWSATVSECADETGLKSCTAGKLGGRIACPAAAPSCVDGTCVALPCTGSASSCIDADTSRTCVDGTWVPVDCTDGPAQCLLATGRCAECANTESSCQGNTRRFCVENAWQSEICSGTTPICAAGVCIACRGEADCAPGETCDLSSGACLPAEPASSL